MPLDTNIQQGDPDHAGIHNTERQSINTNEAALANKANATHGHVLGDTSGLQTALDGKQPAGNYVTNDDARLAAFDDVVYDGDNNAARPNARTVYWKEWPAGLDPANAVVGDFILEVPA